MMKSFSSIENKLWQSHKNNLIITKLCNLFEYKEREFSSEVKHTTPGRSD